jgi:DNA-binding transcriptional LysR family regulator
MTPATMAQRLRALEAEVGSQLIVRSGRTVQAHGVGRAHPRARAHRAARGARPAVGAIDTELPAGPLRLGAIPTGLMGIVPLMMKDWVQRHPDIGIYIEPASTTALYGRVMAGELDAAVLVHPMFDLPKTSSWHSLRREPLVLLTPAA